MFNTDQCFVELCPSHSIFFVDSILKAEFNRLYMSWQRDVKANGKKDKIKCEPLSDAIKQSFNLRIGTEKVLGAHLIV